ncbi:MAG: DMT family transporter [Oscillospiraceae bacterium]|jgi:drug/metabolite transporter (DMT)-like permease|nr:DMT family transporter [Oscillospiraceae bacterium]
MWFLFAFITFITWGVADLFYKKGANPSDKYSHLKTVIAVGVVMGLYALVYMIVEGIEFNPMSMVTYLPVSLMYIISMVLGYVGLRYIALSLSSPIQNSSGAIVTILCFFILGETVDIYQAAAIAAIVIGITSLSFFEGRRERKLAAAEGEDKKYRTGLVALIFPFLYCIIDSLGTLFDAFWLDTEVNFLDKLGIDKTSSFFDMFGFNKSAPILSEDEATLAYMFTFAICALLIFVYFLIFKREELKTVPNASRFGAAAFETAGQIFYVFAMSGDAIVAAPVVSSYCLVSVILSRIFLKEKLTVAQYISIGVALAGIAVLGIYDA